MERHLLTTPDYAALRGWVQQSARDERLNKRGPKYIHVRGAVYYSIEDVESHLKESGYEFARYDPDNETKEQYLIRMNEALKR
jgi:hypothetical protein